jgi:hypothetical protein
MTWKRSARTKAIEAPIRERYTVSGWCLGDICWDLRMPDSPRPEGTKA